MTGGRRSAHPEVSEALHDAQTKAVRFGHVEVDGEHLLLALLDQPEGLIPRLLADAGADPDRLRAQVEAELGRRPRVSGPGAAPGQVFLTQRLSRLLDTAEREAARLKDDYVSVEHLVLALVEEGGASATGRALREQGLNRERFLAAPTGIRGNQRVTSAMPEVAYEAGEVRPGPGRGRPRGEAGPGDRARRRDPAGDPDPVAQVQEQSGPHR